MAGSLRGAPVELVKCETERSAGAGLGGDRPGRICFSGSQTFTLEGPFSEYPGYYGGSKSPKHTIRVECITHRNDPIFHGCLTGASPGRTNEGTTWTPATFSAMAWHTSNRRACRTSPAFGAANGRSCCASRSAKSHRGHAQQVAAALVGMPSRQLRRQASHRRRRRYRYSRLGSDRVGALLSGQRRLGRYLDFSPAPQARCSIPACLSKTAIRSNTAMACGPGC